MEIVSLFTENLRYNIYLKNKYAATKFVTTNVCYPSVLKLQNKSGEIKENK